MDGVAARPARRLQTDFATPPLPAPNSCPVVGASPTRYTSRKNHPKRSDKRFERPHETCSLLVTHYSVLSLFPVADTASCAPARFGLPTRTVRYHYHPAR